MSRGGANGDGTVYRRKDGRYEGARFVLTASGQRKRLRVYGRTRDEARRRLTAVAAQADAGVRLPDRAWRLGAYLDHWLETVVRPTCRPRTLELYATVVRRHLKPDLGADWLSRLSVARLQAFINARSAAGASPRLVAVMRTVLSAALTQAQREELLVRNPARLVQLPTWRPKEVRPWTPAQAAHFLRATADDPLYPAFVLLLLYGLRRGEVLGLRLGDVEQVPGLLHVRQQIQRLDGRLQQVPVKTNAGQRDLPLLPLAKEALAPLIRESHGELDRLVFTTRAGQPVEPHNLARSFHRLREQAGLPRITLHSLRHTTATLLKGLGVPVRDAQLILGHASPLTTQQIYQHADLDDQRTALNGVERLLTAALDGSRCRQDQPSRPLFDVSNTTVQSGGPSGARTHDTLLKSLLGNSSDNPLTGALALVRVCARQRLVGHVAVGAAVSLTPRPQRAVREARCWLSLLNSPRDDQP